MEARLYQGLDLPYPQLDLGCGDGHFASVAFPQGVAVGVDPDGASLREARRRGTYQILLRADGSRLPLASESMASGFSNSVLEHIPDVQAVLHDVARVLQPGAVWTFTVPNPAYGEELSLARGWLANSIPGWPAAYRRWFQRVSRVVNLEAEEKWTEWLDRAGLELVRTFRYFSPEAMRVLERGHFLGLPSLVARLATGRWILSPTRFNLRLTEVLLRRYDDASPVPDGAFSFYLARKRRSS
ncbi:MAG: class I SAM-dependent methyltransferase [Anaerolineales bacterium]